MVRIGFSNLLLKACLDEEENDTDDPLFQVDLTLNVLTGRMVSRCRKPLNKQHFYRKFKMELSDLRVLSRNSIKPYILLREKADRFL